ncbi:excalibur domain-containing protein [Mycolicibacterium flavescens]|uniref:Excalibur domain-containing protein n=1 Tax=Mycolicibacterium flavescens TaxID=1776 RepID=A0A1E3RPH9_MYCFV|nr:excalibur domain-containing protein [Mycolicibacterium flavescens]
MSGSVVAVALGAVATGLASAHPMSLDAPLRQSSDCDSNYSGCVPVASDVDCAGGSGNGPEYVAGPITVIGDDIYELDRDGDGTACDS